LYCRLRPGARQLKQTLFVVVGFGVAGQKQRLFSVLPELTYLGRGYPPLSRQPSIRMRSLAAAVCSKLLTPVCDAAPKGKIRRPTPVECELFCSEVGRI
jgi:hypothetical protein